MAGDVIDGRAENWYAIRMISRYGGRRERAWPQTREGAQARRSGGGPAPALAGRPDGERSRACAHPEGRGKKAFWAREIGGSGMEHLDARLGTIAAMVPRCRAVADIGCDHGLLVAALLEGGRCDYGIAADINPMPLEKARQELTRRGLLAQSECRLTNGLCGIAPVGVDAVVIAGMGGELIADILSRWDYTENPAITYLLQPMTRPVHLRQWLYTHRFTLQEERCCRANGKLYTVLRAQYTGCATEETPAALYFGALDLENDPLAGEYREQVLGRLRRRITGLVEAKPGPERDAELAEATKLLLALR